MRMTPFDIAGFEDRRKRLKVMECKKPPEMRWQGNAFFPRDPRKESRCADTLILMRPVLDF